MASVTHQMFWQDGDELTKEIGIISAELNEPSSQHFEKIGEKLSQHSKHSSFIFADGTSRKFVITALALFLSEITPFPTLWLPTTQKIFLLRNLLLSKTQLF